MLQVINTLCISQMYNTVHYYPFPWFPPIKIWIPMSTSDGMGGRNSYYYTSRECIRERKNFFISKLW
jgi:hypothetical protein